MRTYDPGHAFFLDSYSGYPDETSIEGEQSLIFMHRVGNRYPGNDGNPYDGTNCQEVIRALISRALYLNNQIPCLETTEVITHLRQCLFLFEYRAAREHNLTLPHPIQEDIENVPVCRQCGHISCSHR
jgi:hypothetical protein